MINLETLVFVDMLNKIASEYTDKSLFIAINPQTATKDQKLLCGVVPGIFGYDSTKIACVDGYVNYYPLIHHWKKDGKTPVYYSHTFVGVADDEKKEVDEPKFSIFTFPGQDFDWDTVIGYHKNENTWRFVDNIL